jgi:hypothetical protein
MRTILASELLESLEPQGAGFSRVCEYSGVDLSWAAGGPFQPSIEAIYPLGMAGSKLTYHERPNVGLVATTLNLAKDCLGVLCLPLVALWLAIHDDQLLSFPAKKRRWAWAYNATTNMANMAQQCRMTRKRQVQVDAWSQLSPDLLRAMLETLRTGTRTEAFQSALIEMESSVGSVGILFYPTHTVKHSEMQSQRIYTSLPKARPSRTTQGRQIYAKLLDIAQSFGIPPGEFDYYLTIGSVDGRDRVFYPYHVLSRPQASQFGWDWNSTLDKSQAMVKTMEEKCNSNAVDAGYGEKLLDKVTMIYFLAKVACQKIAELSSQGHSQE